MGVAGLTGGEHWKSGFRVEQRDFVDGLCWGNLLGGM